MTELERELLEALKDAYPYIADDSARHAAGNLIMRAETKAKESQCKCILKPFVNSTPVCSQPFNQKLDAKGESCGNSVISVNGPAYCGHDRACHIVGGKG